MSEAAHPAISTRTAATASGQNLSLSRQLQAALFLGGISLRRLFFSRQTLVALLLLGFAALAAFAWSLRRVRSPLEFVEDFVIPVYVSFLLPVFCLCYGSASISSDREEQTLVYLLLTPVPRPLIHAAKYGASLLLSLVLTVGGLALMGAAAGDAGRQSFRLFWPAVVWSTCAYVGLFHLLSVAFRRATIVALAYALFLETFVGAIPGIAKRVAITFYSRCMIFDAGAELGLEPAGGQSVELFLPISGDTARIVLILISVALFAAGTWLFARREYV
jgi:ABC-type transport system involved in multi-copper enzyme maturation permease subunit